MPVSHVRRVLAVEDNALNQKVLGAFLDHLGHSHILVDNADDALRMLGTETFDVALIDIQLQGTSGLELAGAIRELDPPHPLLLAVTAMARSDGAEFYRTRGFDGYLAKPLTIAALSDALSL